ncbi:sodium-coupled monocarboxylate transporter 2 [Anabrus simplex]|uniref:sodium-coupled monocarboxylate transporter 2 n=1 Tax=Anabrus simplex TaxID=316456 RepID=UPI0035A3AF2B
MDSTTTSLVWDYVLFVVFTILCVGVPLRNTFFGKKETTKEDYVFSRGSQASTFSMILSIVRSVLGVRTILGYPSEMYYRGTAMWETLYGSIISYPIVCFLFLPVYFSLGITSIYQYLDMRFKSRLVRCLAALTFIVKSLLNLGVTVLTPCVAMKTVTGIPYWASIMGISAISIFFTILGGLKAAIIADVIQALAMVGCSLAIIIQGWITLKDVQPLIEKSVEHGRMHFFDFNPDPTVRMTTLSAVFGYLFISLTLLGCQQSFMQRYCSMKSQKAVVKSLLLNIPVITIIFSLSWIAGMAIFATYADCDPLSSGLINNIDEIAPFFVQDQFYFLPGVLGVFLATLFNGSLSLNVSVINSLSTVTWEDFFCQFPYFKNLPDQRHLMSLKIIGAFYGVVIAGISFGVAHITGLIEASCLLTSATCGPLLGVFLLAMLIPRANWKGASAGMIISHVLVIWMATGNLMQSNGKASFLPLSTEGCTNTSFSHYRSYNGNFQLNLTVTRIPNHSTSSNESKDFLHEIYSVTYMYYTLIGCIVTMVFGVIISWLTESEKDDVYEEGLIHPLALKISKWCPGLPRKYLKHNSGSFSLEKVEDTARSNEVITPKNENS